MTRQFQNKGTNIQKDGTLAWLWIRNCYKFNKEEKRKETVRIKQRFPDAPYISRQETDETQKKNTVEDTNTYLKHKPQHTIKV